MLNRASRRSMTPCLPTTSADQAMGFDADSARAALGRCAWDVNKARSRTWLVGISWNRWFRQRGDHLLVVARIDLTECVSATGTHFCVVVLRRLRAKGPRTEPFTVADTGFCHQLPGRRLTCCCQLRLRCRRNTPLGVKEGSRSTVVCVWKWVELERFELVAPFHVPSCVSGLRLALAWATNRSYW